MYLSCLAERVKRNRLLANTRREGEWRRYSNERRKIISSDNRSVKSHCNNVIKSGKLEEKKNPSMELYHEPVFHVEDLGENQI